MCNLGSPAGHRTPSPALEAQSQPPDAQESPSLNSNYKFIRSHKKQNSPFHQLCISGKQSSLGQDFSYAHARGKQGPGSPGPALPCDRVSWSWALVTPHPDPPSAPGAPTWLSDLLEPQPKVSPHPTSCSSDPLVPRGPGPLPLPPPGCSPKSAHLPHRHRSTRASWPVSSAQHAQGRHTLRPPVAVSTLPQALPPVGSLRLGARRTHLGTARGPHGSGAPRAALRRVTGLQRWSECGPASPALPPPDVRLRQPTGGKA